MFEVVLVSSGKVRCVIIAGGGFRSTGTSFRLCEAGILRDLRGVYENVVGLPTLGRWLTAVKEAARRKEGSIAVKVVSGVEGLDVIVSRFFGVSGGVSSWLIFWTGVLDRTSDVSTTFWFVVDGVF